MYWKKRVMKYAAVLLAIVIGIHIVHGLSLDRIIQYKEVSFYSERLPAHMDGYRIAFITDTHDISGDRLVAVVDRLNTLDIDLLLLGGDYQSLRRLRDREDMSPKFRTIGILSMVETADGIFGVVGNHDIDTMLRDAMEPYDNMTLLWDEGVHIREGFFLGGVDYLRFRRPSIASAIEGAQPDDFVILLSHHPDISMRQDTTGVDLILSGHTHGGQITFFGLWAPAMYSISQYGQRFRSGWAASADGVPVYVSNGVGGYLPRIFARPQVILMTLYRY